MSLERLFRSLYFMMTSVIINFKTGPYNILYEWQQDFVATLQRRNVPRGTMEQMMEFWVELDNTATREICSWRWSRMRCWFGRWDGISLLHYYGFMQIWRVDIFWLEFILSVTCISWICDLNWTLKSARFHVGPYANLHDVLQTVASIPQSWYSPHNEWASTIVWKLHKKTVAICWINGIKYWGHSCRRQLKLTVDIA